MATNEAAKRAVINAFNQKHQWAADIKLMNITGAEINGDTEVTLWCDGGVTFTFLMISELYNGPDKLQARLTHHFHRRIFCGAKSEWGQTFDEIYNLVTTDPLAKIYVEIMSTFLEAGVVYRCGSVLERDEKIMEIKTDRHLRAVEWGDELAIYFPAFEDYATSTNAFKDYGKKQHRKWAISCLEALEFVNGHDWAGKTRMWRANTDKLKTIDIEWTSEGADKEL